MRNDLTACLQGFRGVERGTDSPKRFRAGRLRGTRDGRATYGYRRVWATVQRQLRAGHKRKPFAR